MLNRDTKTWEAELSLILLNQSSMPSVLVVAMRKRLEQIEKFGSKAVDAKPIVVSVQSAFMDVGI